MRGLWDFAQGSGESILEDDEIYSNDIFEILKTYGVEMARAAILREISGVFGAYKIDVNMRHLELIADYMVCITLVRHSDSLNIMDRLSMAGTNRLIAREFQQAHRHC